MFCPKCGRQLSDAETVCRSCGKAIVRKPVSVTPAPATGNQQQQSAKPNKKGLGCLIAVIILVLVLALSAVAGFVAVKFFNFRLPSFNTSYVEDFDTEKEAEEVVEETVEEAKEEAEEVVEEVVEAFPKSRIPEEVNRLIAEKGVHGSVAVAVIDNYTGAIYSCSGSYDSYPSWGFYLPVYMAFCNQYPDSYSSYKSDIMSHDAGRCNTAANFAIDMCGGTESISNIISYLGFPETSFGRKFGDVNAPTGNYTTATEAAQILYAFYLNDNPSLLCYKPSSFGVAVPEGATMYAQFGTENSAVKENFNIFAIMEGPSSNYSIAVMTKDSAYATGITDEIIYTVHLIMEGNY